MALQRMTSLALRAAQVSLAGKVSCAATMLHSELSATILLPTLALTEALAQCCVETRNTDPMVLAVPFATIRPSTSAAVTRSTA